MSTASAPIVRGCGSRQKGALYLVTELSPWGSPVEDFLLDPPMPVDVVALGLSPVGQRVIADPDGVYHVVDWVGAKWYPNVQDFVEEVKHHGVSRRISKTLDLSRLTKRSRLLLLHPRAVMEAPASYWDAIEAREGGASRVRCLSNTRGGTDHRAPTEQSMCSGLWAYDVEGGEPLNHWEQARTIGDTTYACPERIGQSSIDADVDARTAPGYFGAFPISNFVVVNDPDQPAKVAATYAKVRESLTGIDVRLEDA